MKQTPNKFEITVTLPDGSPFNLYTANPKQAIFHEDPTKNLIAIGSRGSGKSLALRMDAHMRALSIPNCNLILIRKTFKDLTKSHLVHLPKEMKLLGGTYHATDHIAYYPNGSRLFLSYVGSAKDSLNLLSAEFIAAYFDELSVIPWEFFTMLCASVRVTNDMTAAGIKPVIRAATNPLGESAGIIQNYFVNRDVDPEEDPEYLKNEWGAIQINMEDNPHLDVREYRKQFAGMPDHVRKAWLEGEFIEENALFDFHRTKDGKPYHVIKNLSIPDLINHATIYRAYDHGYFPDPAICLWIAHLGSRYIVFHEKLWFKAIVSEIADDIKAEDRRFGINRVAATFCDPTIDIHTGLDIQTIKDVFESNGIPMDPSINRRELYASFIHTALSEEAESGIPRLQIFDGGKNAGCPYLIKTLPMQQYDEKHPLALANHKHDHATVALAYFLISFGSMEHRSVGQTQLRPWMKAKTNSRWTLGKDNVRDRKP